MNRDFEISMEKGKLQPEGTCPFIRNACHLMNLVLGEIDAMPLMWLVSLVWSMWLVSLEWSMWLVSLVWLMNNRVPCDDCR